MSCDCREFEDLLLDLAYGELEEADAARLRDHAAICASCRAALDGVLVTRKLAAQLPAQEPDPGLSRTVMDEAAREVGRLSERTAAVAPREPGFFDGLRALLLRPAFATAAAAVAVLAISVALYRNASVSTAPDSASPGAPFYGPAVAASAPAPLAETAVADKAIEESEAARAGAEPIAVAAAQPKPALGTGRRYASAGGALGTAGPAQVGSAGDLDVVDTATTRERASQDEAGFAAAPSSSASGSAGVAYAAGKAKKSEAQDPERDGDAILEEAMRAYDRGDCATATPLFARIADDPNAGASLVPRALHHLARCARRSGSCGRAIVYYERLLTEWRGYGDRPEAMWEAAACHRRLGHTQQALALLEELEGLPGWGEKVRAEKGSIEQSKPAP